MAALLKTFVLRQDSHAGALYAFLKANWRAMADAGKPLAVSVAEHKVKRSTQANKRYWAILNQIAAEAWIDGKQFSAESYHEWFRRRFIGCEELPDGNLVGISTTTLDVGSFSDYMTQIEVAASAEMGVEILCE